MLGAIIGSSVIGGMFGLAGSNQSARAAEEAAQMQLEATRESLDFQRESRDQALQVTEPWRRAGENALNALSYIYGVGPSPVIQSQATQPTATGGPSNQVINIDSSDVNYLRQMMEVAEQQEALQSNRPMSILDSAGFGGASRGRDLRNQMADLAAQMDANNDPAPGETATAATPAPATSDTPYAGPAPYSAFYADLEQDVFGRDFEASPGYQFRLNEGLDALDRTASARGMRLSGAALKAANDYGQNMATGEYGNWYNRLLNEYGRRSNAYQGEVAGLNALAGYGSGATANQGQIAMRTGANMANTLMGGTTNAGNALQSAGDARASGYAAANNAIQGGVQNWFMADMFERMRPAA